MYVAAAHSTLQTPQTGPEGELWAECGVWELASLGDVELSGVRDSDLCQELKPVGRGLHHPLWCVLSTICDEMLTIVVKKWSQILE